MRIKIIMKTSTIEKSRVSKRTAIDLFSGAGGLTQGLKQSGFSVVGAVENHSACTESFQMNHPEVLLRKIDITQVSPRQYMKQLNMRAGELDLLAGCPPCQGYSVIGTRNRGIKDDPRNELIFEMYRFAKVFKPKTIMMENVPVLARDERLKKLKKQFRKLGYKTDVDVLNMSDYGVPQARRRMILLASRVGEVKVINLKNANNNKITVRQAIGGLPKAGNSGDPLHDIVENRSERIRYLISMIPKDGGSRTDLGYSYQLECHKRTSGFRDVYGRMSWDKTSPTITGGCTNPSRGRFLHPEENRAITPREAALLQSFPPDYKFSKKYGNYSIAMMIGNALPPKFIQFHAKNLLKHLAAAEG